MYNRYVRNDNGSYSRIPQEDTRQQPSGNPQKQAPPRQDAPPPPRPEPPKQEKREPPPFEPSLSAKGDGLTGFLRHFLDQFHLDHVDTGDLLLLGLLFFLFREDADEELLVALGLLLIL